MPEPLYVLVKFVLIFLDIITFAMLARALFQWFFEPEGKLYQFLYVITEPAIMPLRKLFYKMNWFQDSPIDIAYSFTYLAIFLIQIIINLFFN